MAKLALVAVSLAALLGITQVSAQAPQPGTQDCKSEIAQAEPMVNSMKDEKQKQEAMKEISMAKEMMAKNDEQGCMTQMRTFRQKMQTNNPKDR
jgi:hypothetical protein